MIDTGLRATAAGPGAGAGAAPERLRGSMLSVWKLMGGAAAILSIWWMPAWR